MKIIVIVFLLLILYSLGSALFFLLRDEGNSPRMVKSLSFRIGLSFALFILLFIAFAMGWITPHAL